MGVIQIPFSIPEEYEIGLKSGEYIRTGGVIRNQTGNIVKHLKEFTDNDLTDEASKNISEVLDLKKSLIGIGALIGVSAAATSIYFVYKKIRNKHNGNDKEKIILDGFNAALSKYVSSIKEGNLSIDVLEDFIWNIKFIKENLKNKEIEVKISLNQLEELLDLIYSYTVNLANLNNISAELIEKDNDKDSLSNIIYFLDFQKKILKEELIA